MLNIYKASAGSGKTYTLAFEYIKLLLGQRRGPSRYVLNHKKYAPGGRVLSNPHERILAITFTNKATAEMKSRIIKELELLTYVPADPADDTDYAAKLTAQYGCTREELAEVASLALRKLLDDYGRFNVSTIDAFFQSILRGFAREIDRQGDYRVEIDPVMVLSEAMTMLLDEVNHPSATSGVADVANADDVRHIRQWLLDRSINRLNESADYNPFDNSRRMYNGLIGYLENAFSETFTKYQHAMEEYLSAPDVYDSFIKGLDECIKALRVKAYELARNTLNQLQPADVYASVINFWNKIGPDTGFKFGGAAPKFFDKVLAGIPDNVIKKSAGSRTPDYIDVLAKAVNEFMRGMDVSNIINEVRRTVTGVKALSFINRYIDRYRRDNNLILLADTNTLLNSIISEEDAPFIFERVGVQLENFMIDEFQDTSGLQWHHLRPLLRNSLGFDYDSLIIGDVKQSIYRWRGADSELLDKKVEGEFAGRHFVIGDHAGEDTNYRSSHTVVRFNNTLFELLANHPGLSPDITSPVPGYGGIAQELAERTAGLTGRVCFSCEDLSEELKEKVLREMGEVSEAYVYVERIARNIKEQMRNGYPLRNIAILVRRERDSEAIATYLQRYYPEIKLVSEQALKLAANPSVKKIISALELIAHGSPSLDPEVNAPVDSEAPDAGARINARKKRMQRMMVDCFNYYVAHGQSLSDALRMALQQVKVSFPDPSGSTVEAPEIPVPFDGPDHDLREVRRRAPANLIALVEAVIELKIPAAERKADAQYILSLLDVVNEFSADNIPTLSSFLRFWKAREGALTVAADSRLDAVTISTIHKAKGLEWDCVHVPLFKGAILEDPRQEWFVTDGLSEFLESETGINPGTPPPVMYLSPDKSFALPGNPFREEYDYHRGKSVSDNLNVAYVAFTRAIRELDIYEIPDKQRPLGVALRNVFVGTESSELAAKSPIYMDLAEAAQVSDTAFTIGQRTLRTDGRQLQEKKRHDPMKPIGEVALPEIEVGFGAYKSGATRLQDLTYLSEPDGDPDTGLEAPPAPGDVITPDMPEELKAATRRGLELHSILSRMITVDDLDNALAFHRTRLSDETLRQHGETLRRVFAEASPEELSWFSPDNPRILNEQPIYDPFFARCKTYKPGGILRADRIVSTPDGRTVVIDYKFTAVQHIEHKWQVRAYIHTLRSMGMQRVEGYLWYPLRGEVVKI